MKLDLDAGSDVSNGTGTIDQDGDAVHMLHMEDPPTQLHHQLEGNMFSSNSVDCCDDAEDNAGQWNNLLTNPLYEPYADLLEAVEVRFPRS